ncbi:MAG TPA: zinc ribbon domain-containing protein [Thermoplasmata archaeon]|nr:zinc ribbon domain-containing protein [Thermoplasmata archaeon]
MPSVLRALPIPLDAPLSPGLHATLAAYRLLVNELLREAANSGLTSRGALSRSARTWALRNGLTGTHAVTASGIALSLLRAHRKRLRRGFTSKLPHVRSAFLRVDDQSFHLDPTLGRVRVSLRYGVWDSFALRLSGYHRSVLATPGLCLKQIHLTADRAVLFYEKPAPDEYRPTSLMGLDTNERSLDGVVVTPTGTRAATVPFPDIAAVQRRHVDRRRRIARKKAHDRRVGRRLLNREGRRERHRVVSRLHVLSKHLVEVAQRHRAALALEDFTKLARRVRPRRGSARRLPSGAPRSRSLRRRLSSWPRGELHRQLAYKAAERGVPIIWVDPYRTSVTCPRCGAYGGPRSRMGPMFDCPGCGWRLDRQLNAGANVGRIALRETAELGGLKLDLDALAEDAMRPRYPFQEVGRARAERTVREGTATEGRHRPLSN